MLVFSTFGFRFREAVTGKAVAFHQRSPADGPAEGNAIQATLGLERFDMMARG